MARPRTPIGTFGEIEFTPLSTGGVRARVRFRDHDGQLRRIESTAPTRKLAEHRLKENIARRTDRAVGSDDLTADSSFTKLVEPRGRCFDLVVSSATAADDRASTCRHEGEGRLSLRRSTERSTE